MNEGPVALSLAFELKEPCHTQHEVKRLDDLTALEGRVPIRSSGDWATGLRIHRAVALGATSSQRALDKQHFCAVRR